MSRPATSSWRQARIPARLGAALAALAASAALAAPLDAEVEAAQAYQQAFAALQAEQWAQAELLLERSLMLNPDHAEARLELAGLLARRGRLEAAQALIDSLIDDPRTPDSHRQQLLALRASVTQPAPAAAPPAAWTAETFVAWSRNPLARSDVRELTLTLPDGNITLPVTREVRAAGTVGLALQRAEPGGWVVDFSAQRIGGQQHWQAARLALAGPLPLALPGDEPLQTGWSWQSRRTLDGIDRHSLGLTVGGQGWSVTAAGFTEPLLARQGQLLLAEYSVQQPRWQANVHADLEHASAGEPGHARLGLAAAWALAPHWVALGQVSTQRDLRAYSAWLQHGAPRQLQTAYLALERRWQPAGQPWQLAARAHLGQRWSNIALFGYRDAGVQLSWRRQW